MRVATQSAANLPRAVSRWSIALGVALCVASGGARASEAFACSGTEPFWDLTISPQAIVLRQADGAPVGMAGARAKSALGRPPDYVSVFHTRMPDAARLYVTIVVQNQFEAGCSDGMSERRYSHSVTFITASKVLSGCCNRR